MIAALLLAAAPVAPATSLDCKLVTPGGHPIAFTAKFNTPGVGAVVLEPTPGTVWPSQRVIGGGSHQANGSRFKSRHHIAGDPGIDLEIVGERATLFIAKKLKSGLPRAYGFCLAASNPAAQATPDQSVSVQAGAAIPAFDAANWAEDHCELVTRSGRRWKIRYSILSAGHQSGLAATSPDLFGEMTAVYPRKGGGGRSSFTGKGAAGTERLLLDEQTSQAVQLLDFERTSLPGAEPAAAICGLKQIVRRRTRV